MKRKELVEHEWDRLMGTQRPKKKNGHKYDTKLKICSLDRRIFFYSSPRDLEMNSNHDMVRWREYVLWRKAGLI